MMWRAQKWLTITDGAGEPKRKLINATRKTPEQAVYAVLERLLTIDGTYANFDNGVRSLRGRNILTIDELLHNHLIEVSTGEGAIRELTAKNYHYATKSILRPEYGLTGLAVEDITPDVIREWRAKLEAIPTLRTGKPLGSLYIKKMVMFLNDALSAATATGIIPSNPMSVKTPADKRRAKITRDNEEQQRAERAELEQINQRLTWFPQLLFQHLTAEFENNPSDWNHTRLCYVALSFIGLRPSEVRGLALDKINLAKGREALTISQVFSGNKLVNATKTRSSTRTIPLVEPWLSIVREQVRRRENATDDKTAMLFTSPNGKGTFRQQTQNNDYREIIEQDLQLDYIRLYANRHLTVSALQKLSTDINTISEIVGWEKPTDETMLKVYGHYEDDSATIEALTKLGNFFTQAPIMPQV